MRPSLLISLPRTPLAKIAWRNVRKSWRHSLGSILSIVVGFVAIVFFQGYLSDLAALQARWVEEKSMVGSLLVERRGASSSEGRQDPLGFLLTPEDQAFVDRFLAARSPRVAGRMRVLLVSGLVSSGPTSVPFFAWGHDVEEGARMRGPWGWNAVAGRPLHLSAAGAVLLGGRLGGLLGFEGPPLRSVIGPGGGFVAAERPFSRSGRSIQLTATTVSGRLNAVDAEVAGLTDAGLTDLDARLVQMPLPLAARLLDTDRLSFYAIRTAGDAGDSVRFAADLNEEARAAGLDLVATPWREHAVGELYRRGMAVLGAYRLLVVLVVVVIAGMSVFTTMLKAVNERVREIGALRALGYRRGQIVRLFTLEGGLLALLSCSAGLLVSALAAHGVTSAGISYSAGVASQPIPLSVSLLPGAVAAATLFLVGVALLAALLPARRAARLAIPDALAQA